MSIYADCLSSLNEKTETDRYAPFVSATNDALEKLESLDINGLKCAPNGVERIIFLTNHPNEIPIYSGAATSYRKPDVVVMRLDDAARAYSSSQSANNWGQLKTIARGGAKPQTFRRILSCVEFKATRAALEMKECREDSAPPLDEVDPMYINVDGPAIRRAEVMKTSQASRATKSGSRSGKRAREFDQFENEPGSQPRPAKQVAVESGSRSWYARAMKESRASPSAAQPKQASGSQPKTPQEKTADDKKRDPILQAGSYAVEMMSFARVHAWNILIVGRC